MHALKLGSDTSPVGLWVGALEGYSLLSGHLVCRYSNRGNPDYHPAGASLTGTLGPLYVEAFASDVLGARLMGAQAEVDLQHLFTGPPRQRGRYTLGLSAVHDWGRVGGASPPVTLAHLDGTAVVVVRPGGLLQRHLSLSLGAEVFGWGRVDVDGRLAAQLVNRNLEVALSGLALGLGQPGARQLYSGQVRWRFGHKLYALAEGGTLLFPRADGALRPGAYASLVWGWTMRAEALAHRWAALLGAVLLSAGCVTLAPRPGGSSAEGPRALSMLQEAGGSTMALEAPAPPASTGASEGEHALATEPGEQERLHRRRSARGLGPDAALARAGEVASAGAAPQGPPGCGGQAVPAGWPDFSSNDKEALLAPFLTCSSPGEFVALQDRVDMPRLVAALDDWRAVRLGALGPVREDAAHLLQRKRAAFLVSTTRRHGLFYAEVFALYTLHSAYDDEVDEVLRLLAGDKQLGQTLAPMPAVHEELERRGMPLSRYPDRAEEGWDSLRGVGRAAWDVLSTSPTMDGILYTEMTARRALLPPPYQQALLEVEQALALRHFAPGSVAVGSFDAVTFGVPLGFYYLAAGTGHGLYSLTQGEYEQATRELAPVALLVATLYVEGKGTHPLDKAWGGGAGFQRGLETVRARVGALAERTRQLQAQLGTGVEGLRELARYIQASREAGRLVATGGADAALALYETRGNVAKARPLMSKAKPGASGSSPSKSGAGAGKPAAADDAARPSATKAGAVERPGTLASLVDEGVGHTREVVKAKLSAAELEATGPRLPRDVGVLEKHRPSLEAPPPEAQGNPRWREYVDYYEERLREVKEGTADKGPLKWEGYERLRGWFARGMAFERGMVKLLKADAQKPRAQRSFLGDFDKPRIETSVGVKKSGPGLRFADVLVIEEGELGGRPRRVETFSFKSRDLAGLGERALKAQMIEDAGEALRHYGEKLDIRRSSLQSLLPGGSEVQISRVRLIYEGGDLKPQNAATLNEAVTRAQRDVPGVEVSFQ